MSHTSINYEQIKHLVEFLEHNPGIALGAFRSREGKMNTKRKWKMLASTINTMGGAVKDERRWAKYWAEKKCALKRKWAYVKQHTAGGIEECLNSTCELSSLDKRLVRLLEQPFPGLNNSTSSSTSTVSTDVNKHCSTPLSPHKRPEDTTSEQEAVSSEPAPSVPVLNIDLSADKVHQLRVTIATPSTTEERLRSENVEECQDVKRTVIRNPSSHQPQHTSYKSQQHRQERIQQTDATIKLSSAITAACRSVQTATDALLEMAAAVRRLADAAEDCFILK